MKLRCPYCKQQVGPRPDPKCPHCGRIMNVPGPLRKPRPRKRPVRRTVDAQGGEGAGRPPLASLLGGRRPANLLFILAVMAVVGGMLVSRAYRHERSGSPLRVPENVAEREVDVLQTALERFREDCGRYPAEREGLKALLGNPGVAGWDGPYITLLHKDPWGSPYFYKNSKGILSVFSAGPDTTPSTADDVLPDPPLLQNPPQRSPSTTHDVGVDTARLCCHHAA